MHGMEGTTKHINLSEHPVLGFFFNYLVNSRCTYNRYIRRRMYLNLCSFVLKVIGLILFQFLMYSILLSAIFSVLYTPFRLLTDLESFAHDPLFIDIYMGTTCVIVILCSIIYFVFELLPKLFDYIGQNYTRVCKTYINIRS